MSDNETMKFVFEFVYQLGIVIVVFAASIYLFFNKLLYVIQEREAKTTLLEKDAEKQIAKANELSESYRAKIDIAHGEAQKKLKSAKEKIIEQNDSVYKGHEKSLADDAEKERVKILESIKEKEAGVLEQADTLAKNLVEKIIQ